MEGGRFWFSTEFFGRENRQKLFFQMRCCNYRKLAAFSQEKTMNFQVIFKLLSLKKTNSRKASLIHVKDKSNKL